MGSTDSSVSHTNNQSIDQKGIKRCFTTDHTSGPSTNALQASTNSIGSKRKNMATHDYPCKRITLTIPNAPLSKSDLERKQRNNTLICSLNCHQNNDKENDRYPIKSQPIKIGVHNQAREPDSNPDLNKQKLTVGLIPHVDEILVDNTALITIPILTPKTTTQPASLFTKFDFSLDDSLFVGLNGDNHFSFGDLDCLTEPFVFGANTLIIDGIVSSPIKSAPAFSQEEIDLALKLEAEDCERRVQVCAVEEGLTLPPDIIIRIPMLLAEKLGWQFRLTHILVLSGYSHIVEVISGPPEWYKEKFDNGKRKIGICNAVINSLGRFLINIAYRGPTHWKLDRNLVGNVVVTCFAKDFCACRESSIEAYTLKITNKDMSFTMRDKFASSDNIKSRMRNLHLQLNAIIALDVIASDPLEVERRRQYLADNECLLYPLSKEESDLIDRARRERP